MKKIRHPLTPNINGNSEAVLLDTACKQPGAVASIQAGLAQAKKGDGRHAEEVFAKLESEDVTPVDIYTYLPTRSR